MRDRSAPLTLDDVEGLAWDKMGGLIPAVVQDAGDGAVLMLGYMDRAALGATLDNGIATFFSRSRGKLWRKGETSGNVLRVQSVHTDCDQDALLVLATPHGPTCHLGDRSCFALEQDGPAWLAELAHIVADRAAADPDRSYTARLLAEGDAKVAQKVGEEGVEVALATVTRDAEGLTSEIADLLYHLTVLMHSRKVGWRDVVQELQARHTGTFVPEA